MPGSDQPTAPATLVMALLARQLMGPDGQQPEAQELGLPEGVLDAMPGGPLIGKGALKGAKTMLQKLERLPDEEIARINTAWDRRQMHEAGRHVIESRPWQAVGEGKFQRATGKRSFVESDRAGMIERIKTFADMFSGPTRDPAAMALHEQGPIWSAIRGINAGPKAVATTMGKAAGTVGKAMGNLPSNLMRLMGPRPPSAFGQMGKEQGRRAVELQNLLKDLSKKP